jgi:hypothetical protein
MAETNFTDSRKIKQLLLCNSHFLSDTNFTELLEDNGIVGQEKSEWRRKNCDSLKISRFAEHTTDKARIHVPAISHRF